MAAIVCIAPARVFAAAPLPVINPIGDIAVLTGALTPAMLQGSTSPIKDINIGTSLTTGKVTIGGPAQTGTITLGQSTKSQSINIAHGAQLQNGAEQVVNIASTNQSGEASRTINIGGGILGDNFSQAIIIGSPETRPYNTYSTTSLYGNQINITNTSDYNGAGIYIREFGSDGIVFDGHMSHSNNKGITTATTNGGVAVVFGSDARGRITTDEVAHSTVRVIFGTEYANFPFCVVTPGNASAAQVYTEGGGAYITTDPYGFTLHHDSNGSEKIWFYYCMG